MAQGQPHERKALILYGSETGNSQDVAESLGRTAERQRFVTRVDEMDRVEINQLANYTCVIFAISTTGQGEFPQNARRFWKSLLRKRLPPDLLSHVLFTTFGLGDTSYTQYNWSARKLHKRLEQLGANEFYPRGEADEQHEEGIDTTFLPWSEDIEKHLLIRFPLPDGVELIPKDVLLPSKFELALVTDCKPTTMRISDEVKNGPESRVLDAKLIENKRVTPSTHWQDVRLLSFQCEEQYRPEPGDVWRIWPKNSPEDVQALIDLMKWNEVADTSLYLKSNSIGDIPSDFDHQQDTTLRQLLTNKLDIAAIPKRHFFYLMTHYTTDPTQKERLAEYADPIHSDDYYDFATRPRRSILEVLLDFDTIKLPWKLVCELFPLMRPREYSIASGGQLRFQNVSEQSKMIQVQLLVAIVRYTTVLKKVRQGLCSRYFSEMPANTTIQVCLTNKSKMWSGPKKNPEAPVIMIGPGTGVAPCRSLIYERMELAKNDSNPRPTGPTFLFFGNRNVKADYFFEDEWKEISPELQLQVFTAFSRDQKEKTYIQDVIRKQSRLIFDLINQGAFIYVCGSSGKMPKLVRTALEDAYFEEQKAVIRGVGGSEDGLRDVTNQLFATRDKAKMYIQETW